MIKLLTKASQKWELITYLIISEIMMSNQTPSKTMLKRFLSDNPVEYQKAIQAAESYVSQLEGGNFDWLYRKPFDPSPNHQEYFRLIYDLLNLLQVMKIPSQGKILEVGSGPGWITEILLMLGFQVDALEPSKDFIKIAKDRCHALEKHYGYNPTANVTFHQNSLEEIDFEEESFDAIIFYDVLHHVVDEEKALKRAFSFLKAGGRLGIADPAWHPDFTALEQAMHQEMAKYGTLENPFSTEYLDYLLKKVGFIETTRYVSVNGFFSAEQLTQPLETVANCPLKHSNNMTARKPYIHPYCHDLEFATAAQWTLLSSSVECETKVVSVVVRLKNTGETVWSNNSRNRGYVTVSLRQGVPDSSTFQETLQRHILPQPVIPNTSVELDLSFPLPIDASLDNWELDLVCEGFFWFSSRGIQTCPLKFQ